MMRGSSIAAGVVVMLVSRMLWAAGVDVATLDKAGAASSGLVVHVGATDASLAVELVKTRPVVVLAVAATAEGERGLREAMVKAGVHGQATAASVRGAGRLPVNDELASLVIADLDVKPGVARDEVLRVLRSGGTAYLRQGGQWKAEIKARPRGHGDWGQYHFDATMSDVGDDTTAGPAYGIQWLAGPQDASMQGVRVVGSTLVQPEGRGPEQAIVARDASSGLPLWVRSDLGSVSRYAFMLDAQRVYLYPNPKDNRPAEAMVALDARTGRTVLSYDEGITFKLPADVGKDARRINEAAKPLVARAVDFQARLSGDGALLQAADRDLVVLEAATGKRRWSRTAAEGAVFMHPVVVDGQVFVFEGPKALSYSYTHWPNVVAAKLHCLSLADGAVRWTLDWPADRDPAAAYNLTYSVGKLASVMRQPASGKGTVRVRVVDAASGREEFFGSNAVFKGEIGGGHSSARVLAIGDRLWHTTITTLGGSMSLSRPAEESGLSNSYARLPRPVGCTAYRATPNWLFGSLTTYAVDGSRVAHTDAARTACDVGAFPANGLSYITANHCFCQPYLPGALAFHSRKFAGVEQMDRLERGSATAAAASAKQGGWPMFLRDNQRSAWNAEELPGELAQAWTARPAGEDASPAQPMLAKAWDDHWYAHGPVSQASAAEGVVVAALSHRQQVVALDPATGRERWRVSVDGRVDTAPTIHKGLVLAGTRNGWLYALNRDSGELVWRFFAAPRRELIVVDGQLESPWPLFGTVNVDERGIYAMSGRHTDSDGGLFWYLLDLNGQVLAQGRVGEDELKDQTFGGGNPGKARPTGANTPAVMTDARLLLAGVHLAREADGAIKTWTGLYDIKKSWEYEFWELRHGAGSLVPGNQGLLARVGFLNGYKLPAYAFTQARLYAHHGDDFVMVGGAAQLQHRGGEGHSILRRMKRQAQVVSTTQPNPKEPAKPLRITKGSDLVWQVGEDLPRGNGTTALAVSGEAVLVGLEVTNRDRWRERAAMPYRLQIIKMADGTVRQELPLSAAPILGGIAIADGRVFVTTRDGAVTCFTRP